MQADENAVSDSHIAKLLIAIFFSALVGLLLPPLWIVTFLLTCYWLLLFFAKMLKIMLEPSETPSSYPSTRKRHQITASDTAPPIPDSGNWQSTWIASCESPAEIAFLKAAIAHFGLTPSDRVLTGGGITLELQCIIVSMRVDFLINGRLVVEIDGATWHSSPERKDKDAKRDAELSSRGYSVVRIPAKRVFVNPPAAIKNVVDGLARLAV